MARSGLLSGAAGAIVFAGVFVLLQAWTPPDALLGLLDAKPGRSPMPESPAHTLAIRTEPPAGGAAAIVTEKDVHAAHVRPASPGGVDGVRLELTSAGRERLGTYAKSHPNETLAITVDGKVIATRPAASFAGDGARAIDLPAQDPLETHARTLSARFGGAPVPVPSWALQAARLVIAIAAGFVVLALVRLVTGR
jgi:hypothetical protein